jgi:hypothetical protein
MTGLQMSCRNAHRLPYGTGAALVLALTLLAPSPVHSLEVDRLEIDVRKSQYRIEMSFHISAPVPRVIALLTDFGYPDRLNPDVTSKEVISEQDGVTRVRIGFRGCVLFFCRATAMTQDVRVDGNEITADAIADGGDFKSGRLHWHIADSEPGSAAVRFRATIEHEQFVFPVLGKYFLRKRLREQLLRTAANLEIEASR